MINDSIFLQEDQNMKEILVLGDVFFKKEDQHYFFDLIKNKLKNYLVLANLEGSIAFSNKNKSKKSVLLELPKFKISEIPQNLIFSLVNNHVTDFGVKNFYKNINFLKRKAFFSHNLKTYSIINGRKFIFLADKKEQCIIKGTGFLNFSNNQLEILGDKLKSAIVVVHGGIEYRKNPTVYQRNLARNIIDRGAEMVIFHHSHVVGYHEIWNNKLIHYGLGNAFFSDIHNLHSLDQSNSHAVLIGKSIKIVELKKLIPTQYIDTNINNSSNNLSNKKYAKFYKDKYKINSSFRPRQLFVDDFKIYTQYFIWSLIANLLVKFKISKTIKSFLDKFFNKNK